jgi:hypothetical protein
MKKIFILSMLLVLSCGYAYGEIIQITNYPTDLNENLHENIFITAASLTADGNVFWWKLRQRSEDVMRKYWSCYYYDGTNIVEVQSETTFEPSIYFGMQKAGNWLAYMVPSSISVNIYLSNGVSKTIAFENIQPDKVKILDVNNGFVVIGKDRDPQWGFARNLYLYKPDHPTAVNMSSLKATPTSKQVKVEWQTETEVDNAGFNVWRAEGFQKVNESLIPAEGSSITGADYDFVDEWVLNGKRYFYLLEDIDNKGISTFHGPVKAVPRLIYGMKK